MATASEIGEIIKLYVGYYNRAPDPVGLNFWIEAFDNGFDLDAMADDFSTQAETLANYPFFENENPSDADYGSFTDAVYQNLFNRNPDEAGKAFWVEKLGAGEFSVGQAISLIIEGATTSPDQDVVANKVAVGRDFYNDTNALPTYDFDEDDIEAATAIQAGVTENPATVVTAAAQTDAYVAVISADDARTITLTQNTDAPGGTPMGSNTQGGSGDDSYSGTVEQGGNGTLQNGDTIAAAGGEDTLNVRLVSGESFFLADVLTLNATDLENITVSNQSAFGSDFILDLQATTGEQLLTAELGHDLSNILFRNVDEGTAIKMVDNDGAVFATFKGDRSASTDDAFQLIVEDVGTVARTATFGLSANSFGETDDDFEIALVESGGTQTSYLNFARMSPEEIVVTGTQELHLSDVEDVFEELGRVDASGMTDGGLVLDATTSQVQDFTFVGSAMADTLMLNDPLLGSSSSLSLDGRGGVDTLSVDSFSGGIVDAINNATGFEQVEARSYSSGLEADEYNGIDTFIFNQTPTAGNLSVTGVQSEDLFVFASDAGGSNQTLQFTADGVGQSLNIELRANDDVEDGQVEILSTSSNGGSAAMAFGDGARFGEVVIHSTGATDDPNLIRAVAANNQEHVAINNTNGLTDFIITGEQALTIGAHSEVQLNAGNFERGFAESVNLDGTGATGDLRIAGSTSADRMEGGQGDDVFYGLGGDDVLIGNDGADQFRFTNWEGTDEIIDFTNGEDVIGLRRMDLQDTTPTSEGTTVSAEDYVENIQSISQISTAEDGRIVELQTAQSETQIEETTLQSEVEAYLMVFNATTGKGELWYDADWSTTDDRSHTATFDNVDTLADLVGFSNTDFVEYLF